MKKRAAVAIKNHPHDLAFLDGGEGVYCMDIDCGFRLGAVNLLELSKSLATAIARIEELERQLEIERRQVELERRIAEAEHQARREAELELVILSKVEI